MTIIIVNHLVYLLHAGRLLMFTGGTSSLGVIYVVGCCHVGRQSGPDPLFLKPYHIKDILLQGLEPGFNVVPPQVLPLIPLNFF